MWRVLWRLTIKSSQAMWPSVTMSTNKPKTKRKILNFPINDLKSFRLTNKITWKTRILNLMKLSVLVLTKQRSTIPQTVVILSQRISTTTVVWLKKANQSLSPNAVCLSNTLKTWSRRIRTKIIHWQERNQS